MVSFTIKNGEFEPKINLVFKLKYCITTTTPGNSGYLVTWTRNCDGLTGPAWLLFQDTVGNKELIKTLNNSFRARRLFSGLMKFELTHCMRTLDQTLTEDDPEGASDIRWNMVPETYGYSFIHICIGQKARDVERINAI